MAKRKEPKSAVQKYHHQRYIAKLARKQAFIAKNKDLATQGNADKGLAAAQLGEIVDKEKSGLDLDSASSGSAAGPAGLGKIGNLGKIDKIGKIGKIDNLDEQDALEYIARAHNTLTDLGEPGDALFAGLFGFIASGTWPLATKQTLLDQSLDALAAAKHGHDLAQTLQTWLATMRTTHPAWIPPRM